MAETSTGRICNLTVLADGMRSEHGEHIRVLETAGLSAHLLSGGGPDEQTGEFDSDALYVVIAGEAVIEEAERMVVVTAGDVVLVPAHVKYRFVQQSRKFRTWRIEIHSRWSGGYPAAA